ncbi:hypothetical protein Dimus_004252 [Dionaea muscipula]
MARGRGTRGRGGHTLPEDTLPTSPLPPKNITYTPRRFTCSSWSPHSHFVAASLVTPATSLALADVAASLVSPFTRAKTNSSNIASSCSSRLPVLLVEGSEIFSKELPNVANKVSGIIKSLYDTCMPSWKFVGKEVRDLWFNEFKSQMQPKGKAQGESPRGKPEVKGSVATSLPEEENNRPVALDEVYLNTHLKGGKFCSEKAKKVYKQAAALGLIGGASTSQPTSSPNVEVMTLMAQLMVSQLIAQTQQSTSPTPHQGASPLTFQMQIPAEYLSVLSSHLSASVPPPPPPPPPPSHAAADVESPANEFLDDLD